MMWTWRVNDSQVAAEDSELRGRYYIKEIHLILSQQRSFTGPWIKFKVLKCKKENHLPALFSSMSSLMESFCFWTLLRCYCCLWRCCSSVPLVVLWSLQGTLCCSAHPAPTYCLHAVCSVGFLLRTLWLLLFLPCTFHSCPSFSFSLVFFTLLPCVHSGSSGPNRSVWSCAAVKSVRLQKVNEGNHLWTNSSKTKVSSENFSL